MDTPEQTRIDGPEDDVIGRIFSALAEDDRKAPKTMHMPRSEVF